MPYIFTKTRKILDKQATFVLVTGAIQPEDLSGSSLNKHSDSYGVSMAYKILCGNSPSYSNVHKKLL